MASNTTFNELVNGIKKRVEAGEVNGNVNRDTLILLTDLHNSVCEIKGNPAIKLGQFFQAYPKLAWVSAVMAWVLSGATALAAIAAFMNQMGLVVAVSP